MCPIYRKWKALNDHFKCKTMTFKSRILGQHVIENETLVVSDATPQNKGINHH